MIDEKLLRSAIRQMINMHAAECAKLIAEKPNVIDGHSDGKRVRYVRHEQSMIALNDVLNAMEKL